MELKFLTPTEVWEGFSATEAPLEASITSAETTDNFSCFKQVFTSETVQNEHLRVECSIYYDARWQDARPAVLVLPSFESPYSQNAIRMLVEEGFVTCILDYCKLHEESKTSFPSSLDFAKYPDCLNHLDSIETDARHTPWFVWAKIARRAITLLQEHAVVQKDKIGIMGFGIGAQLSYIVAGTDKRVNALVAVNGGGYRWAEHNARFLGSDIPTDDEQIAYSTGVGAETYAIFITCPTLMIATRDSSLCDIDRLGDMYDLIKSDAKQMTISVSCSPQITKASYCSMTRWLRNCLANAILTPVKQPSIHFEVTDGRLYAKLDAHSATIEKSLFVSYGEPSSHERCWQSLDIKQQVGDNEYICDIPVYNHDELIVAYATFVYPDGNILSTRVISSNSTISDVTHFEASPHASGIVFDGSMSIDNFVTKNKDALLQDNAVLLKSGPFGIDGVSVQKGSLRLYRSMREMNTVSRSSMFHFDANSALERNLCVCAYALPDLKKYTATAHLQGGEFWQKLLLETADFKSEEGRTLTSFSSVKTLEFVDVDGVILNNLLWI